MAGNKNSGRKAAEDPLKLRTIRMTVKVNPIESKVWRQVAGAETISDFVRQYINSIPAVRELLSKEMPQ